MTLLVDSRLGSADLYPLLPTTIPRTLATLQFGDFSFIGQGPDGLPQSIGIERKRIGDLLNSIDSGRLSGYQLIGLLNTYTHVYLLVEGLWRPSPQDGVLETYRQGRWLPLSHGRRRYMAREVVNYCQTLATICSVKLWLTSTPQESAHWLSCLYQWWQKDWTKHRAHLQFHEHGPQLTDSCTGIPIATLTRPPVVARVARELADGVGMDKARALAAKFCSVMSLVMASEKDLREVKGVGKVLAERIMEGIYGECK